MILGNMKQLSVHMMEWVHLNSQLVFSVGTPELNEETGAVHIYVRDRDTGEWNKLKSITSGVASSRFGFAVSLR
jgi:hypothetical protein